MSKKISKPPVVLVKTWVGLLNSNEDKEVKDHAEKMLAKAFGDIQTAAAFCIKNGIKVN